MIVDFRDDWLRAFFVDDVRSRNIPSDLESRLFRKLQMIDVASHFSMGSQPRRSDERLSRRPQLYVR